MAAITIIAGLLSIIVAGFTIREKWHGRRHHRPDVDALRDIAAAIREHQR